MAKIHRSVVAASNKTWLKKRQAALILESLPDVGRIDFAANNRGDLMLGRSTYTQQDAPSIPVTPSVRVISCYGDLGKRSMWKDSARTMPLQNLMRRPPHSNVLGNSDLTDVNLVAGKAPGSIAVEGSLTKLHIHGLTKQLKLATGFRDGRNLKR